MNIVVIKTCHARRAWRDAQRVTWLCHLPGDWSYGYFIGEPATDEPDVMALPVADSLSGIARKLQAALTAVLRSDFTYALVCDDDTFVVADRLVTSGFEAHDWTGFVREPHRTNGMTRYTQGSAFWLSRRAVELVVGSLELQTEGPDDVAVGRALEDLLQPVHDPRYDPGPNVRFAPDRISDLISVHKCLPEQMYEFQRRLS